MKAQSAFVFCLKLNHGIKKRHSEWRILGVFFLRRERRDCRKRTDEQAADIRKTQAKEETNESFNFNGKTN